MLRPTFFVIGARKSGTTSLANYLSSHPQVFMTTPKEPNFYAGAWGRLADMTPAEREQWYESLFAGAGDALARGDASTAYTRAPRVSGVPERIARDVPDARFVYLIRNPVERIRSQYVERAAFEDEKRTLERAVREDPEYLDISRHAFQLDGYLEHFERDQILVISTDQLRTDRAATLGAVLEFIGVDPAIETIDLDTEWNRSIGRRRATARVRRAWLVADRAGMRMRVPGPARAFARALLTRRIRSEELEIGPELEAWIWAELEPDLRRLRSLVGADFDLWGHG